MSAAAEPKTRRERLRTIAEDHAEEILEPRTHAQLAGTEPVCRYAAVTSAGPRESDFYGHTNLIVADTSTELSELLGREAEEGYLAYWRIWDLDAPWDLLGNLEASVTVPIHEMKSGPNRSAQGGGAGRLRFLRPALPILARLCRAWRWGSPAGGAGRPGGPDDR